MTNDHATKVTSLEQQNLKLSQHIQYLMEKINR
jgi:hypothetical protein